MTLKDYIHNNSSFHIEFHDLDDGLVTGETQFTWKATIHFNSEAARFEDSGDFVLDWVDDPDDFDGQDFIDNEEEIRKQIRVKVIDHIIDMS